MAKVRFFDWFKKTNSNSAPHLEPSDKLTHLEPAATDAHITPIDYTKELLNNEGKDRRLFKYYQFYRKRDFHDRYIGVALFLLVLSYALSLASSYLSFPFLEAYLQSDVPNGEIRFYTVIAVLVLIEIVKHGSLATAFRTHYTYREKPIISGSLVALAVGASIYMCVNGIITANEAAYTPPSISTISTQFDQQIKSLQQTNKSIFDKSNWKGKLNSSSPEGKAYAKNEILISELRQKAATEREQKYNKALTKYDKQHHRKANLREYIGYVIESAIVFCNGFFLFFMFNSSFEHIARIVAKYLSPSPSENNTELVFNHSLKTGPTAVTDTNSQKRCNDVITRVTGDYEATGKVLKYDQVANRLRTYLGYERKKERDPQTVKARINYYRFLLKQMDKDGANAVQEILFKKVDWLTTKKKNSK